MHRANTNLFANLSAELEQVKEVLKVHLVVGQNVPATDQLRRMSTCGQHPSTD
jgi:hypothetical protein